MINRIITFVNNLRKRFISSRNITRTKRITKEKWMNIQKIYT